MKVYYELDLNSFDAWGGGKDTLDRIKREGKIDELESFFEEMFPDGCNETAINDALWFESEYILETLGMRTYDQVQSEIEEAEEEIQSLIDEFEEYSDELEKDEKAEYYEENYQNDIEELKERLEELKKELEEL